MNTALRKGEYSGEVENLSSFPDMVLGKTRYFEQKRTAGLHYHENFHLSLLIEGAHIEKRKNREYLRRSGDLIVCYAGEQHEFKTQTYSKNINIELESSFLIRNGISDEKITQSLLENPFAKVSVLKAFHECNFKDEFSHTSLQMLILDLISPTCRVAIKKPFWIKTLEEILKDRWTENISLNELSNLVEVHPVTISKNFPRFFGCSLGEYRRSYRTIKGLDLLKNSSLTASEVAIDCGFSDQSHFIRDLKKFTGFTPTSYKKL